MCATPEVSSSSHNRYSYLLCVGDLSATVHDLIGQTTRILNLCTIIVLYSHCSGNTKYVVNTTVQCLSFFQKTKKTKKLTCLPHVRFEVLTAVKIYVVTFWVMFSYSVKGGYIAAQGL
jgi:hypothetical protein